jgi:hypothetical protein
VVYVRDDGEISDALGIHKNVTSDK